MVAGARGQFNMVLSPQSIDFLVAQFAFGGGESCGVAFKILLRHLVEIGLERFYVDKFIGVVSCLLEVFDTFRQIVVG